MPTPKEYMAKAIRNEEFATAISVLAPRSTEWEVVSLFYSALHYMNAYLASEGHYPTTHWGRRTLVVRLTNLEREYDNLLQLSMDARYEVVDFTPEQVDALRGGDFRRLKEAVLALIGNQI